MGKPVVVAIDGPAGAGKSTIARRVAERLGFTYIDTGAMYRCVALWALRQGIAPTDALKLEPLALAAEIRFDGVRVWLNGEDVTDLIRTPEVSDATSKVSSLSGVRRAMVAEQRRIAEGVSVVMEGRDIGTVVFPGAAVKIYLDASPGVRAERRARELNEKGLTASAEEIEAQIRDRDRRDANRPDSPLRQAPDAEYLDSSALTPEEVEEAILRLVRARCTNGQELVR
jgi:cytidylate kinase